jgi:hypothetical protein
VSEYLFIGGSRHGQKLDLQDDLQLIRFPVADDNIGFKYVKSDEYFESMKIDDYEKRLFRYEHGGMCIQQRLAYVFVHVSLNLKEAAKITEDMLRMELAR